MDNNFNGSSGSDTKKIFEWIGFGCSCFGTFLTIIFSIVTCARGGNVYLHDYEFGMSKWIIGVILAAIIVIVGIVFSILSIERGTSIANISKITKIALIVAAVGLFWAIVPNATICGYNCVLND